jgi:hypothetical protein
MTSCLPPAGAVGCRVLLQPRFEVGLAVAQRPAEAVAGRRIAAKYNAAARR